MKIVLIILIDSICVKTLTFRNSAFARYTYDFQCSLFPNFVSNIPDAPIGKWVGPSSSAGSSKDELFVLTFAPPRSPTLCRVPKCDGGKDSQPLHLHTFIYAS